MSNKVKDISIGNRTYYFFNDISNMKRLTNKLASKGLQKKFLFTGLDIWRIYTSKQTFSKVFFEV